MSLTTIANMCSHIQNASRARLAITSVPSTKMVLTIALQLQAQGFLSSVTRGGLQPPRLLFPTSIVPLRAKRKVISGGIREGNGMLSVRDRERGAGSGGGGEREGEREAWEFLGSGGAASVRIHAAEGAGVGAQAGLGVEVQAEAEEEEEEEEVDESIVTQENVATRRLWLGLKYHDNAPVLRSMRVVSRPRKKITLKLPEIERVLRGWGVGEVDGITRPGECMFVATDLGILDVRQAAEKKRGGLVLCRVS